MTAAIGSHLPDERLVACSLVEADAESRTPAEAAAFSHLADCRACARRYDDLKARLDALREEVRVEADARFPAERLEASRDQIMRRLEALEHPARVLTFPLRRSAAAGGRVSSRSLRPARWAMVAAAAGLVVGLSLGWFADLRPTRGPVETTASVQQVPAIEAAPGREILIPRDNDEALLLEIDQALYGSRPPELQALDAFTPRLMDVAAVIR